MTDHDPAPPRRPGWPRRPLPAAVGLVRAAGPRAHRLLTVAWHRVTPPRAFIAAVLVTTVTAGTLTVAAGGWSATGVSGTIRPLAGSEGPTPSPAPPPEPPRPVAAPPSVSPPPDSGSGRSPGEFVGWAVLDRRTGEITGSLTMADTSTTASMIKAWLVADYLRRTAEAGRQPAAARLDQLTLIIRDSHNGHAQSLFEELGHHRSIERLIEICGLTDSSAVPYYWSNTRLSARDTARMGACLADGRAAGPDWTDWLLDEMRQVRGVGDFGIRHAFPPAQRGEIAIKNGWVIRDRAHEWHVNCLAVTDEWAMGVLTRFPTDLGYQHGAEICRSVAAEQLL